MLRNAAKILAEHKIDDGGNYTGEYSASQIGIVPQPALGVTLNDPTKATVARARKKVEKLMKTDGGKVEQPMEIWPFTRAKPPQ